MLFNSIEFIYFLPTIVILFFLTPHKFRWILLLAASYIFYMFWKVEYVVLIVITTIVDYFVAIWMEKAKEKNKRKLLLILSLTFNLGFLFLFKYYNFAAGNVNQLFASAGINHSLPYSSWLLPVGISFYTFQTLSYTLDVYFGRLKAERHLGYFALYVSFFPQLVAGPIERFTRLAPQLKAKHKIEYENISKGMRLIIYGLFIKMVIADNLATYVDQIYTQTETYSSWDILKGLCLYYFQIYNDFYGYSLIAIGSARLMGIHLMDNFKTPYLAKNIMEFWQRWHISLSTWFRDYLYFPLGGNRVKKSRWWFNICVVFLVSGFWHGASWTFIFWGGLYAIIYLIEKSINKLMGWGKEYKPFSFIHILLALKTFILVTFIWVFFRSQSLSEALHIFNYIIHPNREITSVLTIPTVVWVFLAFFVVSDILLYNTRFDKFMDKFSFPIRWLTYAILIVGIVFYANVETIPFIYFQF